MKKRFITALMAISLCLVSCSNAPEDVRSRTEEQNNISPNAVIDSVREKIGNITFDCDPDPIEAEEFYIIRSTVSEEKDPSRDYGYMKEKIAAAVSGLLDYTVDKNKCSVFGYEGEELFDNKGDPVEYVPFLMAEYSEESGAVGVLIHDNNDSFIFESHQKTQGKTIPYTERQVYTSDNYPDSEYDMNDGTKMTIKQALDQADDIIKKIGDLELMDKNYSVTLKRIAIHDTGDSGKIINLFYTKTLFGLNVNCDGFEKFFKPDKSIKEMRYSYLEISFAGNNDPLRILNYASDSILEKESAELKIKTYTEAKKALAGGLAQNMMYTVTEAGLRYACVFNQLDRQHSYRPMWCFVLNDPTERRNKVIEITDINYYPRVTAYVDAINGDIYYCNPFTEVFSISRE